jgi:hypothetical protein
MLRKLIPTRARRCSPGNRDRGRRRGTEGSPPLADDQTSDRDEVDGVIAESSQNRTLSGVEGRRARVPEWPEAVLEWFRWPNVVAIEGDVFPAERSDVSNKIIGNDLAA